MGRTLFILWTKYKLCMFWNISLSKAKDVQISDFEMQQKMVWLCANICRFGCKKSLEHWLPPVHPFSSAVRCRVRLFTWCILTSGGVSANCGRDLCDPHRPGRSWAVPQPQPDRSMAGLRPSLIKGKEISSAADAQQPQIETMMCLHSGKYDGNPPPTLVRLRRAQICKSKNFQCPNWWQDMWRGFVRLSINTSESVTAKNLLFAFFFFFPLNKTSSPSPTGAISAQSLESFSKEHPCLSEQIHFSSTKSRVWSKQPCANSWH